MGFFDTALAGASLVYSGLSYNRDGFSDNVQMRQTQMYQEKNYHVAWVAAVREEVRDILQIFIGRMSNFMVVNVLIAGIAAATIVEGEVVDSTPEFVVHAFYVSFVLSLLFLLLSMMLATKGVYVAYNSALKFLVEVIPDSLDAYNFDYTKQVTEKFEEDLWQAFRIPFRERLTKARNQCADEHVVKNGQHDQELLEELPRGGNRGGQIPPSSSGQDQDSSQSPIVQPSYFKSLRIYQQLWEPFANAAQTSMVHGIVCMSQGCAYFCMGKLHDRSERWAGLTLVVLFVILGSVLFMDGMLVEAPDHSVEIPESAKKESLTRWQRFLDLLTVALVFTAPFAIAIADIAVRPWVVAVFLPLGYLSHVLFLLSFVPQEWRFWCWALVQAVFRTRPQAAGSPVVATQLQQPQDQQKQQQEEQPKQVSQEADQTKQVPRQARRRTLAGSYLDETSSPIREDPEWQLKHLLAGCRVSILSARRRGGAIMALGHVCAAITWSSMLFWSLVQLPWEDLNARSVVVEDVMVSWPSNIYFKPRALACAGQRLTLADEFGIFALREENSLERLTCSNASVPFRDVTSRCDGVDCWPLMLSREPDAELVDCRSGQAAALLHLPGPADQVAAFGNDDIFAMHSGLLTQYQWNSAQGVLRPLWRMIQVAPQGLQAFDVAHMGEGRSMHRLAVFRKASDRRPAHVEVHNFGSMPPTHRLWMLPWSLPTLQSGCLMENGTAYVLLQDEGSMPMLVRTVLPDV